MNFKLNSAVSLKQFEGTTKGCWSVMKMGGFETVKFWNFKTSNFLDAIILFHNSPQNTSYDSHTLICISVINQWKICSRNDWLCMFCSHDSPFHSCMSLAWLCLLPDNPSDCIWCLGFIWCGCSSWQYLPTELTSQWLTIHRGLSIDKAMCSCTLDFFYN